MTLQTKHLILSFADGRQTKPLDWEIHPGDAWAILGPNGCGKSTLLKHLAGLPSNSAKHIFLNNKSLSDLSRKATARQVGLLLQDTVFQFPQTVWDYCIHSQFSHYAYFANLNEINTANVNDILTDLKLLSLKDRLITTLSGGEKRRVAIAGLLIQAPQYYLLDEPNNHLDLAYLHLVMQRFQKLDKSSASIMALHDINLASQYCNKALLLFADGSLLQGNIADILTADNLQALYQCRFKPITTDSHVFWQMVA